MTTKDVEFTLIRDDRLNVTDKLTYAIMKGGANITGQQFKAVSESNTSHTYNIQVPSQETLVDRSLLWRSTFSLNLTYFNNSGQNISNPFSMLGYGGGGAPVPGQPGQKQVQPSSALAPFPLHSLMSIITATINNTSVSINIQDVLQFILRMNDKRELFKYNSYAPVMFDTYGNYDDAVGSVNNPLGSWQNSADNDINYRGSWVPDAVVANPPANIPDGGTCVFTVTFTTTEPLLLSPFLFCDPKFSNQAFYGIQTMNFTMNVDSTCRRVWRTNVPYYANASLVPRPIYAGSPTIAFLGASLSAGSPQGFQNSELLFTFLTGHPSLGQLMTARNVVNYYEMPRYITQNLPSVANGASSTFTTQTIQLNQIPDKLLIGVRKRMQNSWANDPDCWLPITKINIQFNNSAGLCSTMTPQDLFKCSIANGSNQTWYEFSGKAYSSSAVAPLDPLADIVRTSGSCLCLEMGKDVQLQDDFYAPGSLGNFNFLANIDVLNNTGASINTSADNQYEIVLITVNSGIFVSEKGTSQIFTGLAVKQDVLDVSKSEVVYHRSDVARLIGGGFFDTLKSVASKVGSVAKVLGPVAKQVLSAVPDPRAKAAASALGMMGMAKPKMHERLA